MNGVSPLLNNQLDLLWWLVIWAAGEQSRRLPSQILFSEREVYRKSHNACSRPCSKRKMNLLNILKLKSRNLSKSRATCPCVIHHPLSQKLFHLRSQRKLLLFFIIFYGKLRSSNLPILLKDMYQVCLWQGPRTFWDISPYIERKQKITSSLILLKDRY